MTVKRPRAPQLFTRYPNNPILTPEAWPYTVNAVFNPGAAIGPDGETVLLVRVEDRSGLSHLTVARSDDGLEDWHIEHSPFMQPTAGRFQDVWGVEDPRITRLDGRYHIAYTGFSPSGPLVELAVTDDFRRVERGAVVTPPEDKDAALFDMRFGDRFALIHRPVSSGAHGEAPHIWISFSPDLVHWGDHQVLLESRRSGHWDTERIGLGPPPLRTDAGWLVLYHGVKVTAAGALYRAGLALLETDDPTVILGRSDEWVFGPETSYERQGDVPGVVFPTGWIPLPDGTVRVYYGAADSTVAVATAVLDDLVEFVFTHCVCGDDHRHRLCPVGGADASRWGMRGVAAPP